MSLLQFLGRSNPRRLSDLERDTEDALEVLKESIVERREASRSITKSAVQLRRLLEKGARNGSKPEPAGEGA